MQTEHPPLPIFQQFLIAAGGILGNLVSLFFFDGNFFVVNLFLAGFSALPIYSMDGYQLICLLCSISPKVSVVPKIISTITIVLVAVIGVWLLFSKKTPMLLLFCLYMVILEVKAKRHG
jgi:Zn-dependent protease